MRRYIPRFISAAQLSLTSPSSRCTPNSSNAITLLKSENTEYKTKNTKQQRKREGRGENKAITLKLGGAENCSFNDKVLDDESDEDGDDGENHEEEESALLVRQALSGSVGLGAGPGPRAGSAAAQRHVVPLRGEGHRGAVGTAQLWGVLALPDSADSETVVAAGLQVLDVEGCGSAFVGLFKL